MSSCRHQGTFEPITQHDLQIGDGTSASLFVGHRACPNPDCRCHIFFVLNGKKVAASYPPETLDFDATNLPKAVHDAFEEAVRCHAVGCYVASAIMVRKTLEELCRDRKATGGNLGERIRELGGKVVLPAELLDGIDDLRLLGNDAAHVESQSYDQIGKEEVEVGIEFTKEILKAVYQYAALLGRLRALKKPSQ